MPPLFQWSISHERRPVSGSMIRKALDETLRASGITDSSGHPLLFQPHDFRTMFITEAILNGLPPHIAQVIAGHSNINTTMGYAKARELHQTGAKSQVTCSRRRPDGPQRYYELA
ncbi:tyrosine-type recombinase/integrase, partial [Streptomyces sp. NPDC088246]|uniref:tyrosine-type recombinase/integrase n=1 Tax=Streptomyces sp. NPDC088246 TaxID=3365842 RepID=UPI0038290B8C